MDWKHPTHVFTREVAHGLLHLKAAICWVCFFRRMVRFSQLSGFHISVLQIVILCFLQVRDRDSRSILLSASLKVCRFQILLMILAAWVFLYTDLRPNLLAFNVLSCLLLQSLPYPIGDDSLVVGVTSYRVLCFWRLMATLSTGTLGFTTRSMLVLMLVLMLSL